VKPAATFLQHLLTYGRCSARRRKTTAIAYVAAKQRRFAASYDVTNRNNAYVTALDANVRVWCRRTALGFVYARRDWRRWRPLPLVVSRASRATSLCSATDGQRLISRVWARRGSLHSHRKNITKARSARCTRRARGTLPHRHAAPRALPRRAPPLALMRCAPPSHACSSCSWFPAFCCAISRAWTDIAYKTAGLTIAPTLYAVA